MGHNLLRHASFSLYNHFDTHEAHAQRHDTIFNHRVILICIPDPYSVPCAVYAHARACVCVRVRVCGYVCVYIHQSEFKSPRVCQDIPQE